jgi:hypothetical protein
LIQSTKTSVVKQILRVQRAEAILRGPFLGRSDVRIAENYRDLTVTEVVGAVDKISALLN